LHDAGVVSGEETLAERGGPQASGVRGLGTLELFTRVKAAGLPDALEESKLRTRDIFDGCSIAGEGGRHGVAGGVRIGDPGGVLMACCTFAMFGETNALEVDPGVPTPDCRRPDPEGDDVKGYPALVAPVFSRSTLPRDPALPGSGTFSPRFVRSRLDGPPKAGPVLLNGEFREVC